jgi:hypothetical protein
MSFRSIRAFGVLALLTLASSGPVPIDGIFFLEIAQSCIAHNLLVVVTADATEGATAISSQDFQTIRLYEQYAAAAYCGTNDNPINTNAQLFCEAGNCPLVQQTTTVVPNGKFGG